MPEFGFQKRFTKDALLHLSKNRQEPEWVAKNRAKAFELFSSQDWPTKKDEEWRRTDLSVLSKLDFSPEQISSAGDALSPNGAGANGFVAKLEQADSTPSKLAKNSQLPQKVVFSDLHTAVREHSDLIASYPDLVQAEEGKFAAFNRAFWNKGIFLYLPKNTEVALPFYSHLRLERQGWGVFPKTLVVLEAGSKAILIDDYSSFDQSRPSLANAVTEIHLGPDSHLTYINLQRWGEGVSHFYRQRVKLSSGSHLTTLTVNLGSTLSRSDIETVLAGAGATSNMYGLTLTHGKQYIEQHTRQNHTAGQTTSDLLFKTALFGQSKTIFSGLIQIAKDAQRSDAYQANRNLLLSDEAKVDTLPKLEILANDVRCTHGATVGPIDLEQYFYLLSRGIPKAAAQYLIVEGFFQDVLGRLPLGGFNQTLRDYLSQKIAP